jgi:hypothetical protein
VQWNTVHYYWGYYWPTVPAPDGGWWWVWSSRWNGWQGKRKHSEKTCPGVALSTTNSALLYQGSNPGRGGNLATNRLSYGTAGAAVTVTRDIIKCCLHSSVILAHVKFIIFWNSEYIQQNKFQSYSRNRPWSPIGFEILRISHCLDNRLIYGGKGPYEQAPLYSPGTFLCFCYSILLEAEFTSGPSAAGRIIHRVSNLRIRATLVPPI